jgi:hypothetical protein
MHMPTDNDNSEAQFTKTEDYISLYTYIHTHIHTYVHISILLVTRPMRFWRNSHFKTYIYTYIHTCTYSHLNSLGHETHALLEIKRLEDAGDEQKHAHACTHCGIYVCM